MTEAKKIVHKEIFQKSIALETYLWPDKRWKDVWMESYVDAKEFQTEPDVSQTLYALAIAKRAKVIVETGVLKGVGATPWLAYAAKMLSRHYQDTAYYGIELDRDRALGARKQLEEWDLPGLIIRCDALETPIDNIDLLFIDDDHDHRHLRKEIEYFLPRMSMCGLITVHDIAFPSVMKVLSDYNGQILIEPIFAGGLGVIFPQ